MDRRVRRTLLVVRRARREVVSRLIVVTTMFCMNARKVHTLRSRSAAFGRRAVWCLEHAMKIAATGFLNRVRSAIRM